MQKARKPVTSRKPPVPADDPAIIEEWTRRRVMPDLKPMVEHLNQVIRDELPGLQYAIKWGNAWFGLPEPGWVIEMAAYDVSINVVFHGGADFETPPPLGDTDRSRYVKLKSLEEAQAPELRQWIRQAGRVPGWK